MKFGADANACTDWPFSILRAVREDVPTILKLTKDLAIFEGKQPAEILVSESALLKYGFDANPRFQALIARRDQVAVGLAVYYFGWANSAGMDFLYIEDLFVLPEQRGLGLGTAMLGELAKIAREEGCSSMRWAVFDWNEAAVKFYAKIGAQLRPDLIQVRLSEESFINLSQ